MRSLLVFFGFIAYASAAYDYHNHGNDWAVATPLCGSGRQQSPIEIDPATATVNERAAFTLRQFDSTPKNLVLSNEGHTVQLGLTPQRIVTTSTYVPSTLLNVAQLHFHSPSEHTIRSVGRTPATVLRADLEIHVVNFDAAGNPKLVLGFMFVVAPTSDPFIKTFVPLLPRIPNLSNTVNFDSRLLNFSIGTEFFEYEGSLTTPPCTEGVHWMVSRTLYGISRADLAAYQAVLENNYRNTQNARRTSNIVTATSIKKNNSCTGGGFTCELPTAFPATTTPVTTTSFETFRPIGNILLLQQISATVGQVVAAGPAAGIAVGTRVAIVAATCGAQRVLFGGATTLANSQYCFMKVTDVLAVQRNMNNGNRAFGNTANVKQPTSNLAAWSPAFNV